jgi:cytochrome c556
MRVLRNLIGVAALTALLGLTGVTVAQAQDKDAANIGYRQKLMQSQGFHLGSTAAIVKGEWPHKEDGPAHAKALAADAMLVINAFKAQTADVKTDAKPEIWKEWAKFEEKAKALEEAVGKLAAMASSSDMSGVPAQVKAVSEACGGCHKEFRKPKEQSYKN